MKKVNRFFKALVLIVAVTFVSVCSVYAKVGESVTIDRKTYIHTGVGSRTEAKFHTNMGYGFCITPQKVGAEQGAVLSYVKEETDGGILYLLEHAGTSDMEYLKTQLAIWIYYNNYLPATYNQNSNAAIVQAARALANTAAKYRNYKVNPSISVNGGNVNINLVKIGEVYYYKTSPLAVDINGASTYSVALTGAPNGTQIVSTSGNVTNTFKKGEQFVVRVPEKSISGKTAITLKATATGVRKYVERYSPANSNLQDVVIIRSENVTVNSNITLNVQPAKRTCQFFNGRYYGSNGNIVSEAEYKKQCVHTCEYYNGSYYGSNSTVVSYDDYKKQCIHTCEYYNGQYYGSNGRVVSADEYKKQCVHTCTYYNGSYYGLDGKVVNYDDYKKQCTHTCEFYNGQYYGSNGKVVTEAEYKKQCVHICTQYNGQYYGSNGKVVTEAEYKKQCVHICTQYNGQYYGSNGNVVSYDDYKNQCMHICTQYNGQYYGSNGNVVSYDDYKNQCMHICTQYNGQYYGSNGNVVSYDDYNKQCVPTTTVIVPNTGSNSDSSNLVIGSLFVLGGMGITLGYRKEKKNKI